MSDTVKVILYRTAVDSDEMEHVYVYGEEWESFAHASMHYYEKFGELTFKGLETNKEWRVGNVWHHGDGCKTILMPLGDDGYPAYQPHYSVYIRNDDIFEWIEKEIGDDD